MPLAITILGFQFSGRDALSVGVVILFAGWAGSGGGDLVDDVRVADRSTEASSRGQRTAGRFGLVGGIGPGDLAGVTGYLVGEVQVLADAGVGCRAIAANTPHLVRLGLIGTAFTMQGRFYPEVFSRSGIAPSSRSSSTRHRRSASRPLTRRASTSRRSWIGCSRRDLGRPPCGPLSTGSTSAHDELIVRTSSHGAPIDAWALLSGVGYSSGPSC